MSSNTQTSQSRAALPLCGVTVIEFGHSVAAPYAGSVLAQLGAEVVKIEMPERGDHTRDWGPPYRHGTAVLYQVYNRDKRSVAIDLKRDSDRQALTAFIQERADVVLQNLRPGVAVKYGMDAQILRSVKPSLIYCNLSAFGQKGPLRERPGYDPLMQAFGGIMSVTGEEGRPPVRVGTSIVDMGAGMWSVIGILTALYRRAETGEGCIVDTSLYETAIAWMTPILGPYLDSREVPKRLGSGAAQIVPYEVFETADGYLMIAAGSDGLFERLAGVLERTQWAVDDRFATNGKRVVNRDLLVPMIAEIVRTQSTVWWEKKLNCAQVPNARVQTVDEVVSHAQTEALDIVQYGPDGDCPLVGLPLSFDGHRPPFRSRPPKLGEHTDLVIRDKNKRVAG